MRAFWRQHEQKIIIGAALMLVAVFAFELGFLEGGKREQGTTVIEKAPAECLPNQAQNAGQPSLEANLAATPNETFAPSALAVTQSDCIFVGSKNSDKYHNPASSCAKRIKPENLVCFATVEAAKAKGYVEGCMK